MGIKQIKGQLSLLLQKCKEDKKTAVLLVCAALLLLFLLFGFSVRPAKEETPPQLPEETNAALEKRLCELLSSIEGVGKVRVMLYFDASGETVYARNGDTSEEQRESGKTKKEKDAVVLVKNGSGENGLVISQRNAALTGAAIVCEGGNDAVIRERIVQTVSALFDIKTNHISVMPM